MNEAATHPDRLASLREAAGRMDEALLEEGFDQHGSHAVFVRWQRTSVETLGKILVEAERELGARVEKACARMEELSQRIPRRRVPARGTPVEQRPGDAEHGPAGGGDRRCGG